MSSVQEVTLFGPDGSVKGKVKVVYDNPSEVTVRVVNLVAVCYQDLFEYVEAQITDQQNITLLRIQKKTNSNVYVLFFKGTGSELQICARIGASVGVIDGDSNPEVYLFDVLGLYKRTYPERPDEAIRELVKGLVNGLRD